MIGYSGEFNQNTAPNNTCEEERAIFNSSNMQSTEDYDERDLKNILLVLLCLSSSILTAYLVGSPYGSYLPIFLIGVLEWCRSIPRQKRSYYGLCRLLLYMSVITLWVVLVLKAVIQGIALLLNIKHLPIQNVEHLFPYALIITSYARTKHDMDLHDKRRYIIHFLYDLPAFLLVIVFKLLNHPFNSLCSGITSQCYLGCLPLPSDVETLNNIGIKCVVNMCAEYKGPRKTYEKYHIKQLYLPTIDSTAPSFQTIQKAVRFMKETLINNEKVFVHCKAGMGRSATIVFCHLVASENLSPENAMKLLKEKRPEITSSLVHYAPVKRFLASLKDNNT